MAFDVLAPVPAVTGFTVTAGVESAVLKWAAVGYPVQVWRAAADDQPAAVLVVTTNEDGYSDSPRPAAVPVFYWVRAVRTLSTGEQAFGDWAAGSATPELAEIGAATVDTVHIVPDAVTGRAVYEEVTSEYVRYGTGPDNILVDGSENVWVLPEITFEASGESMVITAICRQSETPMIFRLGDSTVYAGVEGAIFDVTDSENPVLIENMPITVAGWRTDLMTVSGTPSYISTGINRDYYHNFIVDTEAGHTYAVRFTLFCGGDDTSNYILWASDLRQVFWNIYKR